MLTRRDFEARELRELAPYAAKSAETKGRVHPEPEHHYRTAYQRDRDRIVHSTAFRRLEYKTQVFLTHEGDFFRTRLTHTLEVAQISRTLARALNLNEDLTEAVALAHDLGHTPFGHSGEDALNELLASDGGFEHNRHGLRLVDYLEHPYPQFRGLNLTHEVRECIIKHATSYDRPTTAPGFLPGTPPLEGQVVEMADSIAYDSHDLDDALAMGATQAGELHNLAIFRQAAVDFEKTLAALSEDQRIRRIAKLLIDLMVTDAIVTSEEAIGQAGLATAADVRAVPERLIRLSAGLQPKVAELEGFLGPRLPELPRRAHDDQGQTVHHEDLRGVPVQPRPVAPDVPQRAETEGLHVAIGDYIAGMTDRYAQDEYQRLYEPFERV